MGEAGGATVHHDAAELSVSKGFLGHPVGLGYLSFAYAFERFAFYGMQSLLALYMLGSVLRPDHAPHVWGLGAARGLFGAQSDQALSSAIYGLYIGLCYLTPLIGGFVADRWLGRTPTIVAGAIILVAGHALMAFENAFFPALLLLLIGVGFMKGNVATQIGSLYAVDDLRRTDAFQIFVGMFQVAGILAPLICGTLGEKLSWHYGFIAADVSMVIALALYLLTIRHLPPDPPRVSRVKHERIGLTPDERKTVLVLLALVPLLGMATMPNDQVYNAYILWGARSFDRTFFGFEAPASWLGSIDTAMAVVTTIGTIAFWRWRAARRPDPDEITKVAIGGLFALSGPLVLALASTIAGMRHAQVSLWWDIAFEFVDNVGVGMIYAIGMALFSRASPRPVAGLIIGIFYLHLVVSNFLVGWVGGWLGAMPDVSFWLVHVGISGAGTAGLFVFRALFQRRLAPA